jgi:hypothetical protein
MSVSDPGGWADVKGANTWLAGVQISRWINTTWGCGLGWLSSGCGFEKREGWEILGIWACLEGRRCGRYGKGR